MTNDNFEFQFGPGEESHTLEAAVFRALGAVSVCWENSPTGIFDAGRAKEIGDKLLEFIESKQPMLGYATTRELIHELEVRAEISDQVGEQWPKYRTVDSH